MVQGIEVFREYFERYQNNYVLIGGSACDLIFSSEQLAFRKTKDIDMVLVLETMTTEYGEQLWNFIKDGGYQNRTRSDGVPQFYRFDKPTNPRFPYMLEIFSKSSTSFASISSTPIQIEDVPDLSAIILDSEYYEILQKGKVVIGGLSVLDTPYLILYKAKAWLDLSTRHSRGESVDSKNIRKHLLDIIRLTTILRPRHFDLTPAIQHDIHNVIGYLEQLDFDTSTIGLKNIPYHALVTLLKTSFTDTKIN